MPKKILIVDDEPQIVEICRDYLKAAGYETVTASNGAQGLSLARREKPDLIVLDLMMPEMDGLDVTREIRRESDVPIIMLTARVEETDKLIGDIGCFIKTEDSRQAIIGYRLASPHWRKGYAFEAVRCWLEYLFEDMDIHRVTADCDTENEASFGLLEKLGFRREAHFIESYPVNGVYTNEYHYGLLQREWRTMIGRRNTC